MTMALYRLLADTWMRYDPDTIDDPRPRVRRLVKGDLLPDNVLAEEIEYLTNGARPMLVEADSDADPFKDDASFKHAAGESAAKDNPSVDSGGSKKTAESK
jgi:hypothetical protein